MIGPPEGDTPLVVYTVGPTSVLVDRMAYEYQHGMATGPDPAQADLDALGPRVDRVRVLDGGMYRDRALGTQVLLDTARKSDLDALRGALVIVEDPGTFAHCACLGGPTLELYAGKELVATIAAHHGRSVRWYHWKHDALLRDPARLAAWLRDRAGADALGPPPRGGAFDFELLRLSNAERLARRGDSYRLRGDLRRALDECAQALAHDPALPLAFAVRGLARQALGRLAEAEADCTVAIDRGLVSPELHLARAAARDALGRPDDALADCDTALRLNTRSAAAHNGRGLLLGRLGRSDEALADFARAIALDPAWPLPRLNRGALRLHLGRPREAVDDVSEAIRRLEAEADAGPAAAGLSAGPRADALSLAACHSLRAEAHERLGDSDDALDDHTRAVELDPEDPRGYLGRGRFFLRHGDPDRAIDDFSEAVRLRPDLCQGYLERGQALLAREEPDAALDDFDEAVRWAPDEPAVFFARGQVRLALGRTDEALQDLDQVVQIAPENPQGHLVRAQCWAARGDPVRRRADLEQAVSLNPGWDVACNALAWFLATAADPRHRDGRRAVALARQALDACDDPRLRPNHLDTLAAAHAECGDFEKARRHQGQALDHLAEADHDRRAAYEDRLALYESDRPFREDDPVA